MLQPLTISIDVSDDDHRSEMDHLPPPAPKRRRPNDCRESRLAGFASAASSPQTPTSAVERLQAVFRGHRVRRDVARLRPSSASSSYQGDDDYECPPVPEELEVPEDVDDDGHFIKDLRKLAVCGDGEDEQLDSALEESSELESSGGSTSDSLAEMVAAVAAQQSRYERGPAPREQVLDSTGSVCSICLGRMVRPHRRDKSGKAPEAPPPAMSVATLVCSHRYHRKCLLAWCRQQAPGTCPQCRELVRVKRRPKEQASLPDM